MSRRIYLEVCENGFLVEELYYDVEKDMWRSPNQRRVYQDAEIIPHIIADFIKKESAGT